MRARNRAKRARHAQPVTVEEEALRLGGDGEGWLRAGLLFRRNAEFGKAVTCFQHAVKGEAEHALIELADTHIAWGAALQTKGDFDGGLANAEVAYQLLQTGGTAAFLTNALGLAGHWEAAQRAGVATLRVPESTKHLARIQCMRADICLEHGPTLLGAELNEWRVQAWYATSADRALYFGRRQWRGEPCEAACVLSEGGLGDELLFARWLPAFAGRVETLYYGGDPILRPLLAGLAPNLQYIDQHYRTSAPDLGPAGSPLCFAMSALSIFKASAETLPPCPYLSAPPLRAAMRDALAPARGLRVAIVWRTNARADRAGRYRDIALSELAPLFAIPGITWIHASPNPLACADVQYQHTPGNFLDVAAGVQDAGDFASVLADCDLIISVCSMPAHLAGALGKPVWVLLAARSEWRWRFGGVESALYPTARIFRRPAMDWAPVVSSVREALEALMAERASDLLAQRLRAPVARAEQPDPATRWLAAPQLTGADAP